MKKLFIITAVLPAFCLSAYSAILFAPATGAFNWNAAGAWSGSTWNSLTPDDASITSSAGRTITVDGATAGTVTVNQSSNTLTFGNSGTLTINTSLAKSGAGTLRVDAPLAGNFNASITGGVLELRSNNPLWAGNTTVGNGATLRVSNVNTALGTGTVNLEGGSTFAYGVSGSGVTLDNNVSVTGDITLYHNRDTTGNFTVGSSSKTFDLNGGTRIITANRSHGGTINILSDITDGGVTVKGNAPLRFGGSTGANSYTGATTLHADFIGELQLSKAAGNSVAGDLAINGGTLMLRVSDNIADTSTVTMTGGTFRLQDEASTNTTDVVAALVINGGTFAGGGGLALGGGTAANGELRVNSGGVLSGGASGLNIASTVLNPGGKIRPGTAGDGNIGELGISSVSGLTWNGEASAIAQMAFNLGAANAADKIVLSGALTKGTGSSFVFDFLGYTGNAEALFTLIEFASTTFAAASELSAINITIAEGFTGQFLLNTGSLQYQISAVPEPSSLALLLGMCALGLVLRRRSLRD